MQNDDGGVAALSYPSGEKAGSANVETTALSILIYDQAVLSSFPKLTSPSIPAAVIAVVLLAVLVGVVIFLRGRWRFSS